jgi:hypothetical protein
MKRFQQRQIDMQFQREEEQAQIEEKLKQNDRKVKKRF